MERDDMVLTDGGATLHSWATTNTGHMLTKDDCITGEVHQLSPAEAERECGRQAHARVAALLQQARPVMGDGWYIAACDAITAEVYHATSAQAAALFELGRRWLPNGEGAGAVVFAGTN